MKKIEFNVHDSHNNPSATQPSSFISRMRALTRGIDRDLLRINLVKSTEQKDSFSCECFAIANAVALCYGDSLEKIILDSSAFRSQLKKCLDQINLSLFPTIDCERKHQSLERFEKNKCTASVDKFIKKTGHDFFQWCYTAPMYWK